MENNFWKDKKVLITGHTGFKGSWLSLLLKNFEAKVYGVSHKKGVGVYDIINLSQIFEEELISNIICDLEEINSFVNKIKPEIIFHFAAQSLVPYAYLQPKETIETNMLGTYNILNISNSCKSIETLVIATTDKVYLNSDEWNTEESPLGGKEFYSISKVGAEQIIASFKNLYKRHDLNISIIRSGNVIGGGDRGEKRLTTDVLNSIINKKPITIRNPNSIRPWQYILDSLDGYIKAAQYSTLHNESEIFNLNSEHNNSYTVEYLIEKYKSVWESKIKIEAERDNNLTESFVLRLDSSKAKKILNWNPKVLIDETIENIVNWEKYHLKSGSIEYSIKEINNYYEV